MARYTTDVEVEVRVRKRVVGVEWRGEERSEMESSTSLSLIHF